MLAVAFNTLAGTQAVTLRQIHTATLAPVLQGPCLDSNDLEWLLSALLLVVCSACHQEQMAGSTAVEGWRRPLCSGMREGWLQWGVRDGAGRRGGNRGGGRTGGQAAGPGCEGSSSFPAHTFRASSRVGLRLEVSSEGLRSLVSGHHSSPDPRASRRCGCAGQQLCLVIHSPSMI